MLRSGSKRKKRGILLTAASLIRQRRTRSHVDKKKVVALIGIIGASGGTPTHAGRLLEH